MGDTARRKNSALFPSPPMKPHVSFSPQVSPRNHSVNPAKPSRIQVFNSLRSSEIAQSPYSNRPASQEHSTYANLVWNAENSGLRPDGKFQTYMDGLKKSRKKSKAVLKKTIKNLRTSEEMMEQDRQGGVPKTMTYGRRRESNGEYRITFTNHAKKVIRQKNFEYMQKKINQVNYEDTNSHKIVKYLTNYQVDPSVLKQPKFLNLDAKLSPLFKQKPVKAMNRSDIEQMTENLKDINIQNEPIFSPTNQQPDFHWKEEDELAKSQRINFRENIERYIQSRVGQSRTEVTARRKESPPRVILTDRERKGLMAIARGLSPSKYLLEEEEAVDMEYLPKKTMTPGSNLLNPKLSKAIPANPFKGRLTITKADQQDSVPEISMALSPKSRVFASIQEMKTLSQYGSGLIPDEKSYANLDPQGEIFIPIHFRNQAVQKIEAEGSPRSQRSNTKEPETPDEVMVSPLKIGLLSKKASQSEVRDPKEVSTPVSTVRHKRKSQANIKLQERYSQKVETFVSKKEAKKTVENYKNKFYQGIVDDSSRISTSPKNFFSSRPASSHRVSSANRVKADLFKEYKRLSSACKTNLKKTAKMKKSIKKSFGDFKKTFGSMERLMTDRDFEFEAQVKKDIKHDILNFMPNVSRLLRGKVDQILG